MPLAASRHSSSLHEEGRVGGGWWWVGGLVSKHKLAALGIRYYKSWYS